MLKIGKAGIAALGFIGLVATSATSALAGDSNGNFQVKVGVSGVLTDDHTSSLSINGSPNLAPAGYRAETEDMVIPTLTLTYYLNHNLALELFCCFAQASVRGADVLKPFGEIADTWLFPPALTAQYHFDGFGAFRPYVGAGVEWIHYFDEGLGSNGLGATNVKFRDSVGPVVQAGFDYDLGSGWSLGFDFKKVWLDTKITWDDPLAPGNRIVAVHDLDPIIITANLGYRFNLSDLFGPRSAPAPLK